MLFSPGFLIIAGDVKAFGFLLSPRFCEQSRISYFRLFPLFMHEGEKDVVKRNRKNDVVLTMAGYVTSELSRRVYYVLLEIVELLLR